MATLTQLLESLMLAFPREKVTPATIGVYTRSLGDLPRDALERAVGDVISTEHFFPSIARLRERTCERVLALPTEEAALSQIEARQRWSRESEHTRGESPVVHPLVKEALDHMGGASAFRMSENPSMLRAQFLTMYRGMRAESVRSMQLDARTIAK